MERLYARLADYTLYSTEDHGTILSNTYILNSETADITRNRLLFSPFIILLERLYT